MKTNVDTLALLKEHYKPKVEPTTELMNPLYDKVEHALRLVECAFYAANHPLMNEEIGDPIRTTLGDSMSDLSTVRDALHDMIAWVSSD